MEIRYYGHAMFGLTAQGTTIVIDPFNDDVGYPRPNVEPDAVVTSHEHSDHSSVDLVRGRPKVLRGLADEGRTWAALDARVGPMHITGVPTYHDTEQGRARGKNAVAVIEVEGLRVAHLGDLGHVLTPEQARAIGPVDVLMVPVGGHFTIGPAEADRVIAQLNPRVVIPMHFKTRVTASWPIRDLEEFLGKRTGVKRVGTSVTITAGGLPGDQEIWIMA
ncbi:MAG: MBL fold metallo-hydrolase [bacterium]|nr:MBL fold metallo-hydrolase [bacterium]